MKHRSAFFAALLCTLAVTFAQQKEEPPAEILKKRLANGGGHTGWSRAWIVNFYDRLLDSENAYKHLTALLQKSTLPNLFDTHPPFQIDGNFGGTAGIAEMFLQSQNNLIRILPALPTEWKDGFITGLKARGNYTVDIFWKNGNLEKVKILSNVGGKCSLKYKDKSLILDTSPNSKYELNKNFELVN